MHKYIVLLVLAASMLSCSQDSISEEEKKRIIAELDYINAIDQKYAGIPPQASLEKYGHQKAWEIFKKTRDSVGLSNQVRIKALFETYGFLGYDKVGKEASGNFWISIQHADNDVAFQQEILKAMKLEIDKNNASRAEYAMLEDRIQVNLNKKQRFGTQVDYNDLGQAIPQNGLIDSSSVDQLRAAYELPSLKEYYNGMTQAHFEMNKEYLKQKGITEPTLY